MINVIDHKITVNLSNSTIIVPEIKIKKQDAESHKFTFSLLEDGYNYDLTGLTTRIYFKKEDNTEVFQDCTITKPLKGLVTCVLESQCLTCAGEVVAELVIYGTAGELLTAEKFTFEVEETERDDAALESTNDYSALNNALLAVNQYDSRIDTLEDQLENIVQANVKDFGATGDGVTDDTAAVQAAYDSIKANGGTIYFPSGTYLMNLAIVNSYITILGSGRGSTKLMPYLKTAPLIQIGNGISSVFRVTIKSLIMQGDASTTATSIGLKIFGARYNVIDDVYINSFGGDNVYITASLAQSTAYTYFSNFISRNSAGSAFHAAYGMEAGAWTTSVYLTNFALNGYNSSELSTAMLIDATYGEMIIQAVNGWIEALEVNEGTGSTMGTVRFIGAGSALKGWGVAIDGGYTDKAVITSTLPSTNASSVHLYGDVSVNGGVKWGDNVFGLVNQITPSFDYHSKFSYPIIKDKLLFADSIATAAVREVPNDNGPHIKREYNVSNSKEQLIVGGAAFRVEGTYLNPLYFGTTLASSVALWKNATTKQVYKSTDYTPDNDTDGNIVSEYVITPPVTATSTGLPGQWAANENYLYICHATDTWKRIAIAAW